MLILFNVLHICKLRHDYLFVESKVCTIIGKQCQHPDESHYQTSALLH